ncbi:hypothetical protein NDU88_000120 [Pleurodeles waltl]|uniref:Uncharacterized protein n=1 Tax=Pleurodeles waltl TaxID=8319 RepID=A0AAV7L5W4_PLEWA|nr:hypothetical protein NDU88_000120 [Pleurodeles waltl]
MRPPCGPYVRRGVLQAWFRVRVRFLVLKAPIPQGVGVQSEVKPRERRQARALRGEGQLPRVCNFTRLLTGDVTVTPVNGEKETQFAAAKLFQFVMVKKCHNGDPVSFSAVVNVPNLIGTMVPPSAMVKNCLNLE